MKLKSLIFCLIPIFAYSSEQEVSQLPQKNATRSARTCHDLNGAYVTADFLYWKVRQDELQYAAAVSPTFDATTTDIKVRAYEIDYEYKPGFRVGIGGDLPWNGWDLSLSWTRLSFDLSSSVTSDTKNLAIIEGEFGNFGFFGDHGKINWDFTYNSLEFDWGRRLFLDSSLIIRPAFGLKTVWFDNDVTITLNNVETFNPFGAGIPANPEKAIRNFDIWGIGPFFNLYGKWNWIYGLGLAGQFSTSILWYHIDEAVTSIENDLDTGQGPPTVRQTTVRLKYKTHRIRPYVQAFIGLDWEWCFIPKWLSAQLAVGYEVQYFWSMVVNPTGGNDDLPISFEGLTLKARIDF